MTQNVLSDSDVGLTWGAAPTGTPPTSQAPKRPSNLLSDSEVGINWGAQKAPEPSFLGDFMTSVKGFKPEEGYIGRVFKSTLQRIEDKLMESRASPEMREFFKTSPPKGREETAPSFTESMKLLASAAKEHPGSVAGELVKAAAEDPELFLPALWRFGGAKIAQVASKAGKLAPAVRVGAEAGRGAALGATAETAAQTAEPLKYDPQAIKSSAAMWGTLGAAGGTLGEFFKWVGKKGVDPSAFKDSKTAKEFVNKYAAEGGNTAGVTSEKVLEAIQKNITGGMRDADLNAQRIAYGLMQRGASKAEVERIIKANPLVDKHLEAMRKEREEVSRKLAERGASQNEVLAKEAEAAGRPLQPDIVEGTAREKPAQIPYEGGAVDQDLLRRTALGAGLATAGAWAWNHPDQTKEVAGGAAAVGAIAMTKGKALEALREGSLGKLLEAGKYTLKTLERLPQDREVFSKQQVLDQLARQDVSKPEKELLQGILDRTPGDTVSAKDLVTQFQLATGDHTLEVKKTDKWADYGLEEIDRVIDEDALFDARAERGVPGDQPPPSTNLYRLPPHMEVSSANHFSDPRLFGWTRSFDENGVRYVVEIQSDLAQHAKGLSEERRIEVTRTRDIAERAARELKAAYGNVRDPFLRGELTEKEAIDLARSYLDKHDLIYSVESPVSVLLRQLQAEHNSWSLRAEEARAALQAGKAAAGLEPMLKNWPRRLVREELGRAAEDGLPNVRFATADTVAKVEGWPLKDSPAVQAARERLNDIYDRMYRGEPLTPYLKERIGDLQHDIAAGEKDALPSDPRHQGIYQRYQSEVERYLKGLGGKPVTDSAGHSWIEVPVGSKGPVHMYGKADPKFLATVGLIGLGALAGAYALDKDPTWGAAKGAGAMAALLALRGLKDPAAQRAAVREGERVVGQSVNDMTANLRFANNLSEDLKRAVPDSGARELISEAIDKGQVSNLPPGLRAVADTVRAGFQRIGERAKAEGVLEDLRDNYVTHIVDWKKSGQTPTQDLLDSLFGRQGKAGTSSRFARERKYRTFDDLQKAIEDSGLVLRTKDIAEIYRTYATSMEKAIQNRRAINELRKPFGPDNKPLVETAHGQPIPRGWEGLRLGPTMYYVHPDVLPALRHMFAQSDPGALFQAIYGLQQATKRSNVMGSFFHAKSLLEASFGARGILGTLKDIGTAPIDVAFGTKLSGITKALEAYRNGGLGDRVDLLMRSGLTVKPPEDVTRGLLDSLGRAADTIASKFGYRGTAGEKALGTVEKYTLGLTDKFTWDYLQTGLKVNTALKLLEKAERAQPGAPTEKLAAEVSKFVNSAYGGQNWFELSSGIQNDLIRKMAQDLTSKDGRMWMQVAMFAPDWTISTVRTAVLSLGKGAGIKGLMNPSTAADFARLYQLRTALIYFTAINALNYQVSGHWLWDNKRDKSRIEFPDGTSMQPMKHAAEPYHWLATPLKTLANKMGIIPKSLVIATTDLEYAAPGAPKRKEPGVAGAVGAAAGQVLPFSVQSAMEAPTGEAAKRAALGALGVPVYGQTKAERAAAQRRRKREAELRRREHQR